MAGLDDFCGKIVAGFIQCGTPPSSPGIEDRVYAYNRDEFTETYDATNPLILTGLTPIGSAVLYKITGSGDSFDSSSTVQKKSVGPRFNELVNVNISSNSTDVKKLIINGSAGRVKFITVNNDKSTDGAIELFGAVNGLQFTENTVRKASDEDMQGGWKIEAGMPKGLLEPYPPRAILIPPTTGPATYASTLAALEALLTP